MTGDEVAYDALAGVYEWLVPDALLTPQGAAEAFSEAVRGLPAGARVLDCAAGSGQLAVGLALRGFDVVASDASPAMVERTRRLAAGHHVGVTAVRCAWESLQPDAVGGSFDGVFCVGNSLTHAGGRAARRNALRNMAAVLGDGGVVVITSRNWELLRRRAPRLEIADELVERHGRAGLVIYNWDLPEAWSEPHFLDVAVAVLDAGKKVSSRSERLTFWPFTSDELDEDLRVSGLTPETSTYAVDADRYLVTARR